MPAPWKLVLIGGEVTVLMAFTGIGLHLAMQPHRPSLTAPPPLLLPAASGAVLPAFDNPVTTAPRRSTAPATPGPTGLNADWIKRLGRDDRNLLATQWDIVQGLIGGIERYLRDTVVPEMEHKR